MFTDEQIKQLEGLFSRQRVVIQKDMQALETRLRQDISQEIHKEINASEKRLMKEIGSSEKRVVSRIKIEVQDLSAIINKIIENSEDHRIRIQTLEKEVGISSVH